MSRASGPARPSGHRFSGTPQEPCAHVRGPIGLFQRTCGLVPHSVPLGLSGPSPGRTSAGWCFSRSGDGGSWHGARVGAGRYPPPPPFFPLLLRQPATATLSTRTSRTAVTISRIRLMAHLLVLVSPPLQPRHPQRNLGPRLVRGGCLAAERRPTAERR